MTDTAMDMNNQNVDLVEMLPRVVQDAELRSLVESSIPTLTDSELDELASKLVSLSVTDPLVLWGHPDESSIQDQTELREMAKDVAMDYALRDTEHPDSLVVRDSVSMVLELIHYADDPQVLRVGSDRWLWGPAGIPFQVEPGSVPEDADRYQLHANALGLLWEEPEIEHYEQVDTHIAETLLQDYTDNVVPGAMQAMREIREALDLSWFMAGIGECHELAETHPQQEWPPDMGNWSDRAWAAALKAREAAQATMAWAAAEAAAQTLADEEISPEETGMRIALAKAQGRAHLRRWDAHSPPMPIHVPPDPLSYWTLPSTSPPPLDYWVACMTVAVVHLGLVSDGYRGAVSMLVGRDA